ncbi:superoxide dismutase family protein [Limibacter armeniacum]|uniref:superoxide dismutase family protein n=1 Tax=Limibacter armeniacum TaxID=466084 RepID=UPI002FE5CCBA
MKNISIAIVTALLFVGCNKPAQEQDNSHAHGDHDGDDMKDAKEVMDEGATTTISKKAMAQLDAKSGSNLTGTVTFTEEGGKVKMEVEVSNVAPGVHAIHLHEKGDCSSDDGKSAGGHWNPTEEPHGEWGHGEFHMGDIGNLEISEDGKGTLSFETDKWAIGGDDAKKDIIGKAVIIHAKADDMKSQPSGAAGDRIGCGVIQLEN